MKNTLKYTFLSAMLVGFTACDVDNSLPEIKDAENTIKLDAGSVDFSKYVAVGASFTAGFSDGALFKTGQQYSFPNTLASKFKMVGGGDFVQPLMADNIGGMVTSAGAVSQDQRFYFDAQTQKPKRLTDKPGTVEGTAATNAPNFNNYGLPGAKSFHFVTPGYAALNPYFGRMAPTQSTVIAEAASKQPTFFSLSEIGGNDVLGYAIAGGVGTNQTGNTNPATYGPTDITDPGVFAQTFTAMVNALTAGGAKGVVGTVPYVNSLPYFTTVPHNPLDPRTNAALQGQLASINTVYGALNQIFSDPAVNQPNRIIQFKADQANPVVIKDESLVNLEGQITAALNGNPQFPAFVQQFGLPAAAAPLVATLLGRTYGQARPATADDYIVLPSSGIIGTVNGASVQALMGQGLPQAVAGQFSAEGITLPLEDKWVLTKSEVAELKTAVDAYNNTITSVATAKGLAVVDLKAILQQASTTGLVFDEFNMSTRFVFGGLVSLDGVHLTARGYALMANEMLKAIDKTYGSNFKDAKDGLAKAKNYPTNYSPALK